MLEKRGQVTIFIIVGILILISGFLVYYIASERVAVELPEKFIRETPDAILPIRYYVDDCISLAAREALEEIGLHGGWLQDPELATRVFEYSYDPTEGEAVQFSNNGALIPYWYHMASSNDCNVCKFSQRNMPTLETMSKEINRYVNARLKRCLGDFEAFAGEGFSITKKGDAETETSILEGAVLVQVNIPLDIETEGQKYTLENFAVSLPVNLKKIYELAMKILTKQVNVGLLERNLLNLISYSSSVDSNAIPPIFAAEIGAEKVLWSRYAIQEKLKDLMLLYTPFITIPGTHNFNIYRIDENDPAYRLRQGLFTGFVFNILEQAKGFESIDTSFLYMDWPFYFDITPRDGEIVGPDEMDGNFFFLQIFSKTYQMNYDVSFPVVVELRDTAAFNQEGYSFLYALEGNLRNNEVLRGNLPEFKRYGEPRADLFKDKNQWISGEMTIYAFDGDKNPLKGANVKYMCGSDAVNLGQTDANGKFASKFPLCRGGILRVEKTSYYGAGKYIDAEIDKRLTIDVTLHKLQKKKARVKVRWPTLVGNLSENPYGPQLTFQQLLAMMESNTKEVTDDENIILTMTKIGEDADPPLANFLTFEGDKQEAEIQLVPGRYEVNAIYMWLPGVYIPPSTMTIEECGDALCITKEDREIALPEINITPSPLGGALLNEDSGYWNVRKEVLDNSDTVTFYVMREEAPTELLELQKITQYIDSSKGYRSMLEPSWTK